MEHVPVFLSRRVYELRFHDVMMAGKVALDNVALRNGWSERARYHSTNLFDTLFFLNV